jgi:hypothetical protein
MNLEVVDVMFLSTTHGKSHLPHTHTHTHTHTHLDIAYPMNVVSRFINNPQKAHLNLTKHIY